MKKLLYLLTLVLISASVNAQVGYKSMNGYYDFKGNLRFSDTLFVKTTALSVVGAGTALKLDTTGSSVSGYYRIIATNVGNLEGTGTATKLAVFAEADSLYSPTQMTFDSANTSLRISSLADNSNLKVAQADTTLTLGSQSIGVVHGESLSVQSIDFNLNGEMEFKTHNLFSKMTLGDTYAMTINADTNTTFNIVEPEIVAAGANTATFTNAPVAGNALYYLKVRLIIEGTPREVVIPTLRAAP